MDDDALVEAVKRVERHGYRPAPLDVLSDALKWSNGDTERALDRLVATGRITLHKRPDCDPDYATRLIYAGIGARDTPPAVLTVMESIAAKLARDGWTLRTGLSPGADQAFAAGARAAAGRVELYLPWPDFEAHVDRGDAARVHVTPSPSEDAHTLAARFHPCWDRLAAPARRLLARDGYQVLGANLATPAQLVICWTPDGSLDGATREAGGTGQTLRIAHHFAVPVLNLARPEHVQRATAL